MDPIADMLTTIRNAIRVNTHVITIPASKVKKRILQLFEEIGLVTDLKKDDAQKTLTFTVIEEDGKPLFSDLKRISKPGRRMYVGWKDIPRPIRNGVIIVSTSQGIMTGKGARQRHLGGELICEIS